MKPILKFLLCTAVMLSFASVMHAQEDTKPSSHHVCIDNIDLCCHSAVLVAELEAAYIVNPTQTPELCDNGSALHTVALVPSVFRVPEKDVHRYAPFVSTKRTVNEKLNLPAGYLARSTC